MLQALARSVTRGSNVWLSNLRLLSSAAGEGSVGQTLYVGNLPFSTTDEDLQETFKKYGEVVDVRLIINRQTGQSRGFGFVQMQGAEAAQAAIAALDGTDYNGRTLRVNESENKPEGGSRREFGDRREGGDRRRDSWRADGPRQERPRYEGSRGRSFEPRRQQQRNYDDDSY